MTPSGPLPASEMGGALAGVVLVLGLSCDLQDHPEQAPALLWSCAQAPTPSWTGVSDGLVSLMPNRPLL